MTILKNYLATLLKSALVVVIIAFSFASCKKDKQDNNSIVGIWEGEWGNGGNAPQYFIKFEIKSNGEITRIDEQGQVIANGTWTLNGVQFDCTYTHTSDGQTHKIGGLYTDFDGHITGTWGFSPSKTNGGNVEMEKQ
jgi:hypothetical protein